MAQFEGEVKPSSIEQAEHLDVGGVNVKRVLTSGFDGNNLQDLAVDTDGHLQVDSLSGGAGQQYADGAAKGTSTGTVAMGNDGTLIQALKCDADGVLAVSLPADTVTTLTPPAAITGFATSAKQLADGHSVALSATDNAVLDTIDTAIDAINAKLVTGTVIGDVNLGATDNAVLDAIALGFAAEAGAVTTGVLMQGDDGTDRTNVLVDTAGHLQIDVLTNVTHPVTNAGTFAVQATLAAETTKVIGTVNVAASQTIAVTNAGTFITQENGAALTALQLIDNAISGAGFNITQFAGAAVPIGAGLEATAVRVTLPTDGTGVVKLGAGTAAFGKLAANSGVDIGDVDILSIIPGVAATSLGKAIDTALGATDTGVLALAVRDDTLNIRSGTENDVEPLHTDSVGALWTTDRCNGVEDAAETAGGTLSMAGAVRRDTCASSSGASGDNSTINTDAVGALWTDPQGNVAHDGVDAGNPIKIGATAITALSGATMVAAADRTNLYADEDGVQVVKLQTTNNDMLVERVSNTDGASTASTVFGATASSYNCITTIIVHNAHASTNCYVDIRDGTAGTILATIPAPANGGTAISFPVPLRQTTANTALAFDVSAAVTTIYITFIGYKSKA